MDRRRRLSADFRAHGWRLVIPVAESGGKHRGPRVVAFGLLLLGLEAVGEPAALRYQVGITRRTEELLVPIGNLAAAALGQAEPSVNAEHTMLGWPATKARQWLAPAIVRDPPTRRPYRIWIDPDHLDAAASTMADRLVELAASRSVPALTTLHRIERAIAEASGPLVELGVLSAAPATGCGLRDVRELLGGRSGQGGQEQAA